MSRDPLTDGERLRVFSAPPLPCSPDVPAFPASGRLRSVCSLVRFPHWICRSAVGDSLHVHEMRRIGHNLNSPGPVVIPQSGADGPVETLKFWTAHACQTASSLIIYWES